jgi:hypothetical protein
MPGFPPGVHLIGGRNAAATLAELAREFYAPWFLIQTVPWPLLNSIYPLSAPAPEAIAKPELQ